MEWSESSQLHGGEESLRFLVRGYSGKSHVDFNFVSVVKLSAQAPPSTITEGDQQAILE